MSTIYVKKTQANAIEQNILKTLTKMLKYIILFLAYIIIIIIYYQIDIRRIYG